MASEKKESSKFLSADAKQQNKKTTWPNESILDKN